MGYSFRIAHRGWFEVGSGGGSARSSEKDANIPVLPRTMNCHFCAICKGESGSILMGKISSTYTGNKTCFTLTHQSGYDKVSFAGAGSRQILRPAPGS